MRERISDLEREMDLRHRFNMDELRKRERRARLVALWSVVGAVAIAAWLAVSGSETAALLYLARAIGKL